MIIKFLNLNESSKFNPFAPFHPSAFNIHFNGNNIIANRITDFNQFKQAVMAGQIKNFSISLDHKYNGRKEYEKQAKLAENWFKGLI